MVETSSNNSPKSTLAVYKASAGSGKTFRLTIEYIKLLMENPRAYEGILAVTFTNKATEEMKMRILSQLYGLWKRLPDSDKYLAVLIKETGRDPEFISKQSKEALHLLLNNYHFFKVQTIDTFFQGVLRNLARELQLNAGLKISLNDQQVVDESVDQIIDDITVDKRLRHIIMEYVSDSLRDNKSWDVTKKLKKFGDTIFKEHYKQHRKELNAVFADDDFFSKYKKNLYDIYDTLQKKYTDIGKRIYQESEKQGLTIDSFSNKAKGPFSYFKRLAEGNFNDKLIINKTVSEAMENPEKWTTNKAKNRDAIIQFATNVLIPTMQDVEQTRPKDAMIANSVKLTLSHINDICLLRDIEKTAYSLNNAIQRFLLSDTQSLLNELIGEDDAPFIFEKIGARLQHIMIDEFQDTSTVQWKNFKTLLNECMSQGNSNLIVGDVKQSIYRFRSGDWRLLNGINAEFRDGELSFPPCNVNFRSMRNIVNFNNAFFSAIAAREVEGIREFSDVRANQLLTAYADVQQGIPDNKPAEGLVRITMLPKSELTQMNKYTLDTINELLSHEGVRQKDIALLLRGSTEIKSLAKFIEENSNIKVVSSEAFRLDASRSIFIIITAMRLLLNRKSKLLREIIRKECGDEMLEAFLQKAPVITMAPLHEIAEEVLHIFKLDERFDEGAYLTLFFDKLHSFCNDASPLLNEFLDSWEEEICKQTIESGDIDGVRILTIHKSKGLEFPHVILPYCNWPMEKNSNTLWVTPKVEPFSQLPLVSIDYYNVNSFRDSIYEEDGFEEHIQNVVDNINILYVAMTRAGETLHIIGERTPKDKEQNKRSFRICEMLTCNELSQPIGGITPTVDLPDNEDAPLTLTYGEFPEHSDATNDKDGTIVAEEEESRNVFTTIPKSVRVRIGASENNAQFMQSNLSREFADDSEDEKDRLRMIRKGTVLHQLFSQINIIDDVDTILQQMEFDGTLYDEDITKEDLTRSIQEKFQNPSVSEWFKPGWRVFNERAIVEASAKGVAREKRPDRVITDGKQTIVIDYKFGAKSSSHHVQVREYMELMCEMGMPGDIKGFIWYVTPNHIVEVKEK